MEVRRGRYLQGFEQPYRSCPTTTEWDVPLRDHDYVFLKGHRLMVQVQSNLVPANRPQSGKSFVPSIYKAEASDFSPATTSIISSTGLPSRLVLPVMP